MSKRPCCVGEGLKKGAWASEEDKKLISYIREHGEGGWRDIPEKAGLQRCGKSCRLRWANYLNPDIKRGGFSYEEEQIIILLHASRGNKWSVIARHLPKRTDNEIKNYWNTCLKKRLIDKGIDPVTHKPLAFSNPSPTEPDKLDSQQKSNPDEQSSQLGSTSSISISLSSSFNNIIPEITSDETPTEGEFLSCKKRFERSSSTSRLLNKVADRASNRSFLSTCIEGTLRSCSSHLPNSSSQSSEHRIDNKDQDLGTSIDLSIPDHDSHSFSSETSTTKTKPIRLVAPIKIYLRPISHQH